MESIIYRERVLPSASSFLLPIVLGTLVFAMLLPLDEVAAWVSSATVAAIVLAVLILKSPKITCTGSELVVGRARISREYLGKAEAISAEQCFAERGHLLNANAYTSIQGSIRTMVKVQITDPSDPTPYWLFTTRNPEKLVTALS